MATVLGVLSREDGQWTARLGVDGREVECGPEVLEGDGFHIACWAEPLAPDRLGRLADGLQAAAEAACSPRGFVVGAARLGADLLLAGEVDGRPLLWRGPIGLRPLYWSRAKDMLHFSTRWRDVGAGGRAAEPLPPGTLFDGDVLVPVATLDAPSLPAMDLVDALPRLGRTLQVASEARAFGRFALAFSGGLDSALLASCLPRCPLVAVGLRGARDLLAARETAGLLGREGDLVEVELSEADAERLVVETARLARHPSRMDLELGAPLLAALQACRALGAEALVNGQGADELFGGYARYERRAVAGCFRGLDEEMRRDLGGLWSGLDRDHALADAVQMEIRYPYLDIEVVRLAVSIPAEVKVQVGAGAGEGYIRKFPLREVARLRLPNEVAMRPKRAMQYGSGVHRVVERMAKRGGLPGDGA